jgi:hypothetical protein
MAWPAAEERGRVEPFPLVAPDATRAQGVV